MIGEIKYGKSFGGILRYAMEKEGSYLIGSVRGTQAELTEDFEVIADKNSRIAEPVFHMSIAIHPEEHLDDAQWEHVAETVMTQLGYDRNLCVIVRHTDEPQQHIHLIASRICNDTGKVVENFQEKVRASGILSDLERVYGLRQVSLRREAQRRGRKRTTRAERARSARTGRPARKSKLQDRIDYAARDKPGVSRFLDRLNRLGVGIQANIGGKHVSGVTFELGGWTCKGSTLGKNYSWHGLSKRLDYDPERDFEPLQRAKSSLGRDPADLSLDLQQNLKRFVLKTALKREASQKPKQPMHVTRPSPVVGLGLLVLLERWGRVAQNAETTGTEDEDPDDPRKRQRRNRGRNR